MVELIYLDNAATTKPKFFRQERSDDWFNSNTAYAHREQSSLELAKEQIKKCLNVKGGYVLFFRCATEAVEWLFNASNEWGDIRYSQFSHDSVVNAHKRLNGVGESEIYVDQLINPITGDYVALNPWYLHGFFGCDYTAAIGHTILPDNPTYDFIFFSGHKFYTEKGIGAIWISNRLGQYLGATKDPKNQYNLVHGTVDVQGARMLANAMEWVNGAYDESHYKSLVTELNTALFNNHISFALVGKDISTKTYAINAIHLDGINADALQTYLASKDIYIGVAHSACAGTEDYRVLKAMGFNKEIASQTIRVSFSVDTTVDEVRQLAEEIKNFKEMF